MDKSITYNSFPTATILGLVFIVLKLTHTIHWSWIWVLAPYWIPAAIVIFLLALVAVVAILAAL